MIPQQPKSPSGLRVGSHRHNPIHTTHKPFTKPEPPKVEQPTPPAYQPPPAPAPKAAPAEPGPTKPKVVEELSGSPEHPIPQQPVVEQVIPPSDVVSHETYDSLINKMKARREEWIRDFAGKANYNPYVEAVKWIDPLINLLKVGLIPMGEALNFAKNVPEKCPPIDPNYVPPKRERELAPQFDPKQFGEKNMPQ